MITKKEIKTLGSLSTRKHRRKNGLFLFEGVRIISEVIAAKTPHIQIYVTESFLKNPKQSRFMQTIKDHAHTFEAKTYYAGVGLGHGSDYAKPVLKGEDYTMVYNGLQEIT